MSMARDKFAGKYAQETEEGAEGAGKKSSHGNWRGDKVGTGVGTGEAFFG